MKAIAAAAASLAVCAVLPGCHGEQTYTDGLYRSYLSDGNVAAKP